MKTLPEQKVSNVILEMGLKDGKMHKEGVQHICKELLEYRNDPDRCINTFDVQEGMVSTTSMWKQNAAKLAQDLMSGFSWSLHPGVSYWSDVYQSLKNLSKT